MQSWNTNILISYPYKKQLQYCNIGSHGLMNQKTINQTVKEQIMLNFIFFYRQCGCLCRNMHVTNMSEGTVQLWVPALLPLLLAEWGPLLFLPSWVGGPWTPCFFPPFPSTSCLTKRVLSLHTCTTTSGFLWEKNELWGSNSGPQACLANAFTHWTITPVIRFNS